MRWLLKNAYEMHRKIDLSRADMLKEVKFCKILLVSKLVWQIDVLVWTCKLPRAACKLYQMGSYLLSFKNKSL